MTDLSDWLATFGLGHYSEAFERHAIDWDVLVALSDCDLAELGIPLGDRKRLLSAIARLAPAEVPSQEPADREDGARPVAERRFLTVMFVDIVGSTGLARRLDPEDLRALIRRYQERVAPIVTRMGGFIARYLGDGILAYFGYPQAHEDDARRAVAAGLDIVESVKSLTTAEEPPLRVRVGIATGLTVVGDIVGSGPAREVDAVGETPNMAAHLQASADENTVAVCVTTFRLVQECFEMVPSSGAVSRSGGRLAGAWQAVGPRRGSNRWESSGRTHATPFVNREHELALMSDRWELAKEGEGQLILVSGDPGIGKSRLIQAFQGRLHGEPHIALQFACSAYHQGSLLHPVIDFIKRAASISLQDTPAEIRRKLHTFFTRLDEDADSNATVFAQLMSVPDAGTPTHGAASATTRDEVLTALTRFVFILAARKPLLLVLEDAHWADPTTHELLEWLADRLHGLPLMLIATYRADFAHPLAGHRQASLLKLNRLRRPHCKIIVEHLARQREVPEPVINEIISRADGVALFVEELTKAVLEADAVADHGDRPELPPLGRTGAIPTTLSGSLMARLDRAPRLREVAQIGAVIGREFAHEMIASVSGLPAEALRNALDGLVAADLLQRCGAPPQETYRFKHVMVQEAAYESLLRSRRRELHARLAGLVEERFPHVAQAEPAFLAHHHARAGAIEAAIGYRLKASRLAMAQAAMNEALAEAGAGLALIDRVADAATRKPLELELQVALASTLRAARAPSAPETGEAWARARALCADGDTSPHLPAVLYGQFLFHQGNAELRRARHIGEELLAVGQARSDPAALLRGYSAVGRAAFGLGDFEAAHVHLEGALATGDETARQGANSLQGPESRVLDLCYLSWTQFVQGRANDATHSCEMAVATAARIDASYDLAVAHGNACYLWQFLRDAKAVARHADEVVRLAAAKNFPAWLSLGRVFRGWVLCQNGDSDSAVAMIDAAVAEHSATGEKLEVPYFLMLLAECQAAAERPADGLASIDTALAMVEVTRERWIEPELYRLKAELLTAAGRPSKDTAACLDHALGLAHEQGAWTWALRAAMAKARHLATAGDIAAARSLLEPLLDRVGRDTGLAEAARARTLLRRWRGGAPVNQP